MNARYQVERLPEPGCSMAGDGDESHLCSTCAFSHACLATGFDRARLSALECVVEHLEPFHAGDFIFRRGDPFHALFALRSGAVKICRTEGDNHQQVLGFYGTGDVIGVGGIYSQRFPCDAIALDVTYLCRLSFPAISTLASQIPAVQQHLLRVLSERLGSVQRLNGNYSADARVAAFLLDLVARVAARGFSPTRIHLSMPRTDIASYLRLAAETVSRVMSRFRARKLIAVRGRDVELLNPDRLRDIGQALLPL